MGALDIVEESHFAPLSTKASFDRAKPRFAASYVAKTANLQCNALLFMFEVC